MGDNCRFMFAKNLFAKINAIDKFCEMLHNSSMEIRRFYFDEKNVNGELVTITGDEFHHIVNVNRCKVGDEVILFCGDGFDYFAKIFLIDKSRVVCTITDKNENRRESKVDLTIFQAVPKRETLNVVLQKATEIGVKEIVIFSSEHGQRQKFLSKYVHRQGIIVSASKQCGRSILMKMDEEIIEFEDACKKCADYDLIFVCYESENRNLLISSLKAAKKTLNNPKIALFIGPEGGFAYNEIQALRAEGAKSVSLGNRILRTETAAIFAASVIMSEMEDDES